MFFSGCSILLVKLQNKIGSAHPQLLTDIANEKHQKEIVRPVNEWDLKSGEPSPKPLLFRINGNLPVHGAYNCLVCVYIYIIVYSTRTWIHTIEAPTLSVDHKIAAGKTIPISGWVTDCISRLSVHRLSYIYIYYIYYIYICHLCIIY